MANLMPIAECKDCEQFEQFADPGAQMAWAKPHIDAEHHGVYCYFKEAA